MLSNIIQNNHNWLIFLIYLLALPSRNTIINRYEENTAAGRLFIYIVALPARICQRSAFQALQQ